MPIPADFARDWETAWNSHDIDRILGHYAEDVVFHSRKAIPLTGSGRVEGKAALRAYWSAALDRQPDLHFTVTQTYLGHGELILAYRTHAGVEAAERLRFDADGLVTEASACHANL